MDLKWPLVGLEPLGAYSRSSSVGLFLLGVLCGVFAVRWLQRATRSGKHATSARAVRAVPTVTSCPSPTDPEVAVRREVRERRDKDVQARFLTQTGEGCGPQLFSNMLRASPFENEFAKGEFLKLHRPTDDPELVRSGNYPHSEAFVGRNVNWEARVSLCFKQHMDSSLVFGIELEEYVPVATGAKYAMAAVISALKMVVGSDLHHSVGDDPKYTTGELERPVFVMPIKAIDQVIVTPAGQQPPSLTDPNFRSLGMHRAKDRNFSKKVDALQFKPGATYTFSFWSIAKFIDNVRWEMRGILPGVALSYNIFCGKPPVHLVFYSLDWSQGVDPSDARHLDSRKRYYFRVAFWSAFCKPEPRRLQELLRGAGELDGDALAEPDEPAPPSKLPPPAGQERPALPLVSRRRAAAPGRTRFLRLGGCWDGMLAARKDCTHTLKG